jgi:hypothetical protein
LNINCYRSFSSEKGLRQHWWQNVSCKNYVLVDCNANALCKELIDDGSQQRRRVYGIESMRLNPTMSTNAPFYGSYDEFDYCAFDANDDDIFSKEDNKNVLQAVMDDNAAARMDKSISSPAINAVMERMKARDRASLHAFRHDVEHRSIVSLLKILEDAECPDYMLQSVLLWAYNAKLMGFDFNPKATTRKANVQWMYNTLQRSRQSLPQVISVNLEDHDVPQNVVCFDFAPSLLSLLQDDNLMQPENLVMNLDDPTSMFLPTDNMIGEAHTGERYRELFKELITSRNQLLVPIILYLDGTAIDSKGHIELCPVSFTTSLFSEKVRRDSKAWRLLGYVPDLNRGRSSAMNNLANVRTNSERGRTTRNFHSVMDVIFKGMVLCQAGDDPRLENVPLKVGGMWIVVNIVCPLLFVINDGKQGDQLCGRMNGHHRSQRRHHRSCNCMFEDLDNADVQCAFLRTDLINDACRNADDDILQELTMYRVDNAFNRIQMGRNPHGIFMCAVIDVMHTVQHGVIMYVLESFKKCLSNEKLAMLDRMAMAFDKTCCQSIRSSFPRTDFSRGITNLTSIECSEQSGALFLFTTLAMQVQGWHALDASFPNLEAVLGTMECLLCFEAWLDQSSFWEVGDESAEADAEDAIASMMKLIVKWLPRQKGNQWKVSKFHELKHIVRFIATFGGTRGYNASRPEEHHKAHAKRPGRRSHKNVNTIDEQCGRRIADTFIINTLHALFEDEAPNASAANKPVESPGEEKDEPQTREEGSGTRYQIKCFRDLANDNELCLQVLFNTQTRGNISLEDNLARFIMQNYSDTDFDSNGEGGVDCCTEYHKYNIDNDDERLISLRCHPNFRGKGHPWYDWAVVRTEDGEGNVGEFPSRIVSCIPRFDVLKEETSFDLVVQCCTERTGRESFLFTEWSFVTDFFVLPATSLVGLCFVVVSSDADSTVLVVNHKSEWPSFFYDSASVAFK